MASLNLDTSFLNPKPKRGWHEMLETAEKLRSSVNAARAQEIKNDILPNLLQAQLEGQEALTDVNRERIPYMRSQMALTSHRLPYIDAQTAIENARLPLVQEQSRNAHNNLLLDQLYKDAQTKKMLFELNHPLVGKGGAAGQIGAEQLLSERGGSPLEKFLQLQQQTISDRGAKANWYRVKNTPYNRATQPTRRYMEAMAFGMGYNPSEALNAFSKSKTLAQLAAAKNMKLEDVVPRYSPSSEVVRGLQKAAGREAELQTLSGFLQEYIGNYADTYGGLSIKQVMDTASQRNPERLGKFLAANALTQEEAVLRNVIAGGPLTESTISDLRDRLYGFIKPYRGRMSAATFRVFSRTVNQMLEAMLKARRNQSLMLYRKDSQSRGSGIPRRGDDTNINFRSGYHSRHSSRLNHPRVNFND